MKLKRMQIASNMKTTVDYQELYRACRKRGYNAPENMEILTRVVQRCTAYKFRRRIADAWQYEIVMPGYGKSPNMEKWLEITVIR